MNNNNEFKVPELPVKKAVSPAKEVNSPDIPEGAQGWLILF